MKTVNIIVEGTKDVYFIHEFILRRFPTFLRTDNLIPQNRLKDRAVNMQSADRTLIVHVKGINGFSDIGNLRNLLNPRPDTEGDFDFGIVFDADYPKPGTRGGFTNRLEYLHELMKTPEASRVKVSESVFLFPNNKDNGDLELLMEGMVSRTSDHMAFLEVCWRHFSECIRHHSFNPSTQKSKMNEYTAAFYDGAWDDNGINKSFAVEGLWNWTSVVLEPLYKFLERLLHIDCIK